MRQSSSGKLDRIELQRPKQIEEMFMEAKYEKTMHESLEITTPTYANNPAQFYEDQRRMRKASGADSSFGSSCSSNQDYKATDGITQELPSEESMVRDEIPSTQDYLNMAYREMMMPEHEKRKMEAENAIRMNQENERTQKQRKQFSHHVISSSHSKQTKVTLNELNQVLTKIKNKPSDDYLPLKSSKVHHDRQSSSPKQAPIERVPLLDSFSDDSDMEDKSPSVSFGKNFSDFDTDSSSDDNFVRESSDRKQTDFEPEDELDEILENTPTENFSPTSTLSRAFSRPKRKHKKILKIRNVGAVQKKTKDSTKVVVSSSQQRTLQSVQAHCSEHRIEEESLSRTSSTK